MNQATDYLVIGSGIAGLTTAYLLAELGEVTLVTKGELKESSTYLAQGGVAAVLSQEDHFEKHIQDTLEAGRGHCDEQAVRYLVENGPKAIRFLRSIGVDFQDEPVLEAGHSVARVWRTDDFTGQSIFDALLKAVKKQKNIHFKERAEAVELAVSSGECMGAFIRYSDTAVLEPLLAKNTILATGGAGQLFKKTTNPLGLAGDGLAMALNADLILHDMEFIQFHPTAFATSEGGRYFLLSEALRGFGARIVNAQGKSFLDSYDSRGELAPRDVLARAIYFEEVNGPVYLDLRHIDGSKTKKHFPHIFKKLKSYGLDLAKDLIPVSPAVHYFCGGIPVDLKGATALPGLFAVGEVACAGVHGANRLASNSLLEAIVFSKSTVSALQKSLALDSEKNLEGLEIKIPDIVIEDLAQVKVYAQRISEIMWENVGLIRTHEGLLSAEEKILSVPSLDYRINHRKRVCQAIIKACIERPDSLGSHYMTLDI